jgi:hypothetical protein
LGSQVSDPDVREAFEKKFRSTATPREPEQILKHLSENGGLKIEDFDTLSAFGNDKLAELFRKRSGDELKQIVQGALFFRNVGNADERMKALTQMAERALRSIATKSLMNAKRVRNFGVDLELRDNDAS